MKKLSIFAVCFFTLLSFSSAMATGNNNTHNNNIGNDHVNIHPNIHNKGGGNGNGDGGGDQSLTQEQNQEQNLNNDINIKTGSSNSDSSAVSDSDSSATSDANANNEGVTQTTQVIGGGGTGGAGGGGGAGGNATGGNSSSSSNSSARIGDVKATVTINEAQQYPVPGEINLPGVLNTPNNDRPGPSYYDPREMVFVKYVFTVEELKDMAGSRSPATTGDLQEKEVLPENQQSRTIAFYIEALPNGLKKENVRQIGMLSLDSNSKKISTVTLFGVLGLEAAKRGANAVVISGEGYQRVDKALSFGPGASMTSPTGNSIATVALPFIFAQRWKVDNPWLHGTAIIVPTT
ncbi:MAG: hypothetical protein RBS77_04570 [Candidatus Moranbacteria bacterium]|jgi:hypothetical protein|nr:hypothetical protein [Candidatus Moranbacteria bacterium]